LRKALENGLAQLAVVFALSGHSVTNGLPQQLQGGPHLTMSN
jgi:hypothetical protein